jgi:hypothetical protein
MGATTRLEEPNDRHPTGPLGWAVLKTEWRDVALQELNNFVAFANSWFGVVPYRTTVFYNADARRVDICFQSKDTGNGGASRQRSSLALSATGPSRTSRAGSGE